MIFYERLVSRYPERAPNQGIVKKQLISFLKELFSESSTSLNMPIPSPFNTIITLNDAKAAIATAGVVLGTQYTNFPSPMVEYVDLAKFLQKAYVATNSRAANAAASEMLGVGLRSAAPLATQVYCMSRNFLDRSKVFFDGNPLVTQLANTYDSFLPVNSKCDNPETIQLYLQCVNNFRTAIRSVEGMEKKTNAVTAELAVGTYMVPLMNMMTDMIVKRNSNLGTTQRGTGANHLEEVRRGIDPQEPMFSFALNARTKRVVPGAKQALDGNLVDYEGGALLLTTALLADEQQNGNLGEKYRLQQERSDTPNVWSLALHEALSVALAANEELSPFSQQGSNIDQLFLSHFMVFKILGLTIENFYKFQRVIYLLGSQIRGKAAIAAILERYAAVPGISRLKEKLSKSTDIHSPPWVMNHSRLQDMVGIFGCCDSDVFERTISHPAVSWRYISNIKSSNVYALKLITSMWAIEQKSMTLDSKTELETIFQSEKALHQLLLTRACNFQNTNFVTGNALSVTFHE